MITLTGKIKSTTNEAILFFVTGNDNPMYGGVWFPKSQVRLIEGGPTTFLEVPEWLIEAKKSEAKQQVQSTMSKDQIAAEDLKDWYKGRIQSMKNWRDKISDKKSEYPDYEDDEKYLNDKYQTEENLVITEIRRLEGLRKELFQIKAG